MIEGNIKEEKAVFAAGCFWHVEDVFSKLKGVVSTRVGYTGGESVNPSYARVSSGNTGHAEAVEVTFNPKEISYKELLEVFWKVHNPTSLNRQGPDIGNNYRSAIFYSNEKQKVQAIKSKEEHGRDFGKPIVTEIKKLDTFYPAEEYHQKYIKKHGGGSCNIN